MTEQEFREKENVLNKKHSKEKEALHIEYANSNNPYKRGDILEDHYQIILVDEIKYSIGVSGLCKCIYRGVKLKKNLKPFKSEEKSSMYQGHVEHKLN